MSAEEDKYPTESGRRRFVKGVVGSAALTSVGTATAATVNTTTNPTGKGGGSTTYMAIENTGGPAPRGMPQIPIRIDDEGYLKGYWPKVKEVKEGGRTVTVAREELGGKTYSAQWFQYCGVQTYPGLKPKADQDNYFRYADNSPYKWQREEVSAGDKVNVDDFSNYLTWGNGIGKKGIGKPAMVTWRSQGLPAQETIPVQVLRSERIKQKSGNQWISASTQQGFIAWMDKCTHFCCVPAFKAYASSAKFGAANEVYCQCHQSVYDPFSIVEKTFVALPRPEE